MPRPDYEQVSLGLTKILGESGITVEAGFTQVCNRFAPDGPLVDYSYAERRLTLHPWISPRAKTEALLHQTVLALTAKEPKKKKGKPVEQSRRWVVEAELARHYGLPVLERDREAVALTATERSLVERIVGAVEGQPKGL